MPRRALAMIVGAGAVFALGVSVLGVSGAKQEDGVVDARAKTDVSIVLTEQGFVPREIRIRKGTRVTFTTARSNPFWPASNPHPTHSIYPAFDPMKPLDPRDAWSFVFDKTGTWGYHDHIRSYFIGTIYVE